MEQRLEFIRDVGEGEETFAELCRRYGISRQTGYKWQNRYQQDGEAGLSDESRAPKEPGRGMSDEVREAVLSLRARHPLWGPRKLRRALWDREPETAWPAASSIGELLKREGLTVGRQRRKHTPPYTQPLAHATAPNAVWTADYKGWFLCGDGQRCDPLTIVDACSRFLLRCRAVDKTDGAHTRAVFEAAFREYGLPDAMRSDNGPPFASPAPAGLSRLAVWWMKLGIQPERIDPGCPQQNGRHERLHRTLKQATAKPPQANLRKQQGTFAAFEREYNYERPHEALQDRTPGSVYTASARSYPSRLAELEPPDGCGWTRRVSHNGYISWKGSKVFLSEVLAGEPVGFQETDDGLYEVYFGPVLLGWFDGVDRAFVADRGRKKR